MIGAVKLMEIYDQNKVEWTWTPIDLLICLLVALAYPIREAMISHFLVGHQYLRMMMKLLSQKSETSWMRRYCFLLFVQMPVHVCIAGSLSDNLSFWVNWLANIVS